MDGAARPLATPGRGAARASRHLGLPLEIKDGNTSWHYKSGKIKISARKNVPFGDGERRGRAVLVPLTGRWPGRVARPRGLLLGHPRGAAPLLARSGPRGRRPQARGGRGGSRPRPRPPRRQAFRGRPRSVLPFGLTVKRGGRSEAGLCHVSEAERRLPGGGPGGDRSALAIVPPRACLAPLPAGQAFWWLELCCGNTGTEGRDGGLPRPLPVLDPAFLCGVR